MQESPVSPLARLVLFIVCLSIAGSIAAGVHYFVVDLPEQKALSEHPPANTANSDTQEKCNTCRFACTYVPQSDYYQCLADCELICD
jgi:hypothetical protein